MSPEMAARVAAVAAADYDEVVAMPSRRDGVGHVVDFDGCWAPCRARNVAWRKYPGVAVVGELSGKPGRHAFRAHAIVGQDNSPSSQLQRLAGWRFPVSPYVLMTKPTVRDLVDVLVGWARVDRGVAGLVVVAWRRRRERCQFPFALAVPLHFVNFRVAAVRWRLTPACTYRCALVGRAFNPRYAALKKCRCSGGDVVRHALEQGCVATVAFIGGAPAWVVAARGGATGQPHLPVECVVEGGEVRAPPDLRAVMEIRAFMERALGVALPLQKCWDHYRAGAVTVGDWLALPTAAVADWDEEWADFFDRRRDACLDQPTLMHASGCFGDMGALKLAMVASAAPTVSAVCPYELCGAPGLSSGDVTAVLGAWARYTAFLDRHRLHTVQLQFEVRPIEEEVAKPPRAAAPRLRAWSFPPADCSVRWFCRMCAKPPPSPDLTASM